MNVTEIIRRVRDSAGDLSALQFTDSTVTDWINDGVRECAIENGLLQKSATSDMIVGQDSYNLPPDILKLYSVVVDSERIRVITLQEWQELNEGEPVGAALLQARPRQCYIWAGNVVFHPVPDLPYTLKINYVYNPVNIVFEAQDWETYVPVIPTSYHARLVDYCLAQVAQQDDNPELYQIKMGEFRTGVKSLEHQEKQEDDLYSFISVSTRDMGADITGDHYW